MAVGNMYIGGASIDGMYLGSQEVDAMYIGDQKVFPTADVTVLKYKAPAQVIPYVPYSDTAWTLTLLSDEYDSGTTVGEITFSGTGLTIPYEAFKGCTAMTEFTIGKGVASIGENGFSECSGLTSITINSGVNFIDDGAFGWCEGLGSITIPRSVTGMGLNVFYACSALTEAHIPDSVVGPAGYHLNGCFQFCRSLTGVTLPSGMTAIGSTMFRGCTSLTSVAIPDGVTAIGDGAFNGTSAMTSVTIPSGVTTIGSEAFRNNGISGGLSEIHFNGDTPPATVGTDAFQNVQTGGTLYCSAQAVSAYTAWLAAQTGNITTWTVEIDAPANNEVWYTTSAGTVSQNIANAYFYGANDNRLIPVSNTYSNGLGVLQFGEDIVRIGGGNSDMFDVSDCVTLVFPESVRVISDYTIIEGYAAQVKSVKFSGGYLTSVGHECFHKCPSLETLEMPEIRGAVNFWCFGGNTAQTAMTFTELSGLTDWYVTLTYPSIFDLPNMRKLRMPGLAISTDLSAQQFQHNDTGVMTAMTESAWATLFGDLATVSNGQQLGVGTDILANLSAATKAIATNKGWTLY